MKFNYFIYFFLIWDTTGILTIFETQLNMFLNDIIHAYYHIEL